jgi:hypothetical protein
MKSLKKIFYKALFKFLEKNKLKRKQMYTCLTEVGIKKYRELANLSARETAENTEFPYFISLACIIKNEGPYLKEWIEYHKLIGVEHFYVYDNESDDNGKEVLKPYIDSGLVTYLFFPGKNMQDAAYEHCCKHFKNETKWLAVLDLDEFIVLKQSKNLREFMAEFSDCSQLSIHWKMYGSSGHEKTPLGGVLANFKAHADNVEFSPKSIFNPRTVVECGAHYMWVCGKWVNENKEEFGKDKSSCPINKAQVNHYIIKSWEEFYNRKAPRGCVDTSFSFGEDLRRYFDNVNHNEVSDDLMMPYVDKLKAKGVI